MAQSDYEIRQARYDFQCGVCGITIKKGSNYTVDKDGDEICTHLNEGSGVGLPITTGKTMGKKVVNIVLEELKKEKALDHLRKQNLMMRLELEEISARPNGKAAGKILDKYRRHRKQRDERYVASQN